MRRTLCIDAEQIAYTCSPRHIQSVIEDLLEEIKVAEQLQSEVLSLNPEYLEIGAGKMQKLQDIARRLKILGE
jgi:hypothetical protein